MKKVEDLKIQKVKAQDELNLAKVKLDDISAVEKRLRDQLESLKKSGAPSEEILRHLKNSLKVAEDEKKLAMEVLKTAKENLGESENNMKIAMDKLAQMSKNSQEQKDFERKFQEEVDKRVKANQKALKSGTSSLGGAWFGSQGDITPLTKKELEELERLRSLGFDELSEDDKKRLLMLGQRQLATMESSNPPPFSSIHTTPYSAPPLSEPSHC